MYLLSLPTNLELKTNAYYVLNIKKLLARNIVLIYCSLFCRNGSFCRKQAPISYLSVEDTTAVHILHMIIYLQN